MHRRRRINTFDEPRECFVLLPRMEDGPSPLERVQSASRENPRVQTSSDPQEAAFGLPRPRLISRRSADESGLNRFNKEHSRRLAANATKLVAFEGRRANRRLAAAVRNDVSVSVSMEASHRVRVVSIVIQREDHFVNPPRYIGCYP